MGAALSRRVLLAALSLRAAGLPITSALLLTGAWVSALLYRRCAMCLLGRVFGPESREAESSFASTKQVAVHQSRCLAGKGHGKGSSSSSNGFGHKGYGGYGNKGYGKGWKVALPWQGDKQEQMDASERIQPWRQLLWLLREDSEFRRGQEAQPLEAC